MSSDHADWIPCSLESTTFTCKLPNSVTDGAHGLRFRSKNKFGVYMATTEYASLTITYDHTSPQISWTDTSNEKKVFESLGNATVYTTDILPSFSFTKSADSTSGISKYQVLINGKVYLDDIFPTQPNNTSIWEDDQKVITYSNDSITVRPKKEDGTLQRGKAYKWKVRAVDTAGNTSETAEKNVLIDTHAAVFSNTFFPLVLLNISEKKVSLSSLNQPQTALQFTTITNQPTFYGIAPVNTKIQLKIEKINATNTGRESVFESTTTANAASRFGINLDSKLNTGDYYIHLSATNFYGDFVELPEFTLTIQAK